MKKSFIILIIVGVLLLIAGLVFMLLGNNDTAQKEDKLTVAMYCMEDSFEYDIETNSYKYKKIELTDEQQKKIIKLYKRTNIGKKQDVQEILIGTIKLEFSDGNVISMDKNNSEFAHNGKYCIRLSSGFKQYLLDIID